MEGKYSEPEKLGPEINSDFYDFQPFISPDGRILIFASTGEGSQPFRHRPGEVGGGGKLYPRADLYVSIRQEGKWTPARHLEHGINSFAEEEFPFLTPDGRYLFFSSERSPFLVPAGHRLAYDELETDLHSLMNGHGNIFFLDAEALEVGP
jgi:Tol biopolymer transport system component